MPKEREHIAGRRSAQRNRKLAITGIVVTGALAVAGALTWQSQVKSDGGIPTSPSNTQNLDTQEREILLQEASRLGILPSPIEQELWEDRFMPSQPEISIEQANIIEVQERYNSVLSHMQQSENPYFREAEQFLWQLDQENRIRTVFFTESPIKGKTMGVFPITLDDGRLGFEVQISVDQILNRTTGLTMAGSVVHEMEHVEQMIKFVENSGLPTSQAIEVLIETYKVNPDIMVRDEAEAYANDALAYIYQSGLMNGDYDQMLTGAEERAVEFIRTGQNPFGEAWIEYIKPNVISEN